MKLREQAQKRERRPNAAGVLNPEVPTEPTLNEQIGLSPVLEARLRSHQEFGARPIDMYCNQMETLVHLITLFPAEAEKFREQTPVDSVVPILEQAIQAMSAHGIDLLTLTTLYYFSLLAPKKIPILPASALTQWLKPVNSGLKDRMTLVWAARAIRLDPHCEQEVKKKVSLGLVQVINSQPFSTDSLIPIQQALQLDPTLHRQFHLDPVDHAGELITLGKEIRMQARTMSSEELSQQLATFKILLADEITVSPTGILLAVEKPRLRAGNPLPDRSLAV